MRTKWRFLNDVALVVLVCTAMLPAAAGISAARVAHLPVPAQTDNAASIVLNEVMPKAATGGVEWMEIRNTEALVSKLYLPIIARAATDSAISTAGAPNNPESASAVEEGVAVAIAASSASPGRSCTKDRSILRRVRGRRLR